MCGIFGYAGNAGSSKHEDLFNFVDWLAAESEVRGIDSTGFAARFDSGHMIVDKMPYRASVFTGLSHKFKRLKSNMPSTFIGHTRLGTGSSPLINNNNHPFIGKDFHMVHNGVIPSWRDIANQHSLDMNSETDSEVILRLLEKRCKLPLDKSVEWVLNNIWGNMAIALLDKKSPNIWLFRNENPIHVFTIPDKIFSGDIRFFCSTKSIFDSAWKSAFNCSPESMGVESQYLDSNNLFKISTKFQNLEDGSRHKFTVYRLNVKSPFSAKKQYYGGTTTTSGDSSRSWVGTNPVSFYSSVLDLKDVSKGCRLSKDDAQKLRDELQKKNAIKNIQIDGLSIEEYTKLKSLVSKILDEELADNIMEDSSSNSCYF